MVALVHSFVIGQRKLPHVLVLRIPALQYNNNITVPSARTPSSIRIVLVVFLKNTECEIM